MLIEALVEPTVRRQLRVAALFGHTEPFRDKIPKNMTLPNKMEGPYSLPDICYGRADSTTTKRRVCGFIERRKWLRRQSSIASQFVIDSSDLRMFI